MAALPATDRTKLAKLLGLLGSNHQGERDAAGLAAHRLVQSHNATWFDVVAPVPSDDDDAPEPTPNPSQDWRTLAAACGRYPHLLDRWEYEFIIGLPRFPRLSVKQHDKLRKIATRLRAAGCKL